MPASHSTSIPIETGDPAGASPASFTRFVLPFAWSLEPTASAAETSGVYRRDDLSITGDRRKYFTPETAKALYDRALWLKLEGSGDDAAGTFTFHVERKAIAVEIAPPRLVLFEADVRKRKPSVTGTGFLLVDVSFPAPRSPEQAPTLDDLLLINERFRYWRCPWEGHLTKTSQTPSGDASYQTLLKELRSTDGAENHPYFDWWENLLRFPVEINGARFQLVSNDALENSRQWIDSGKGKAGWIAYTDDRAFVWTCALTPGGSHDASRTLDPVHGPEWVRLLNVDPTKDELSLFEREWSEQRTYTRWKEAGTLYGFTTHSGAMLGAPVAGLPTWQHFRELYFDELLLLLYLRVSIFRFKAELAEISEDLTQDLRERAIADRFRDHRALLTFLTNLYRFPLLSSQQQGIEMYVGMREALDIHELFTEVHEEVKTTHEMFELLTTSRMGEATAFLAIGGLILGVLTTVMTFLAVEDLKQYRPAHELVLRFFDPVPRILPSFLVILISLALSLVLAAMLSQRLFGRWWLVCWWHGWFRT